MEFSNNLKNMIVKAKFKDWDNEFSRFYYSMVSYNNLLSVRENVLLKGKIEKKLIGIKDDDNIDSNIIGGYIFTKNELIFKICDIIDDDFIKIALLREVKEDYYLLFQESFGLSVEKDLFEIIEIVPEIDYFPYTPDEEKAYYKKFLGHLYSQGCDKKMVEEYRELFEKTEKEFIEKRNKIKELRK